MKDFVSLNAVPAALTSRSQGSHDDVSGLTIAAYRLWRQKVVIAVATLACALGGWGIASLQTPMFHARATILLEAHPQSFASAQSALPVRDLSTPVLDGEIAVLRSPDLMQTVVEGLPNQPSIVQFSQDTLQINRLGNGYAIEVIAVSASPNLSADIANGITQTYITQHQARRILAVEQATVWLQQQVSQTNDLLRQATERLAMTRRAEVSNAGVSSDVLQQHILHYAAQLAPLEDQSRDAQLQVAQLQSDIDHHGLLASAAFIDGAAITELRAQMIALTGQDASLALTQGAAHPDRAALAIALEGVTETLGQEVGRILTQRQRQADTLANRVRDMRQDLRGLETQAVEVAAARLEGDGLEFEIANLREDHARLTVRLNDARSQITAQHPDARIISPARVPTAPNTPKTALITAFAGLSGLTLVLLFSAIWDSLYPGFRRSSEVQKATGIDVIAALPGPAQRHASQALKTQADIPRSAFSRQIRHLRTALVQGAPPSGFCALFASVDDGTDAPVTALALAQSCASQGQSTLYINLRCDPASMTSQLGLNTSLSLSDFFEGRCSLEAAIQRPSGVDFSVLGAGRDGSVLADWASTEDMRRLLDTLRSRFRMIIIDAPSLTNEPDGLIVAPAVDAVLVEITAGKRPTTRAGVQRGLGALRRVGVVPAGFIFANSDYFGPSGVTQ